MPSSRNGGSWYWRNAILFLSLYVLLIVGPLLAWIVSRYA